MRNRLVVVGCALVAVALLVTAAPAPPVRAVPTPAAVPSWCERTATGYRCMVGPIPTSPGQAVELMTGVAAPSEAGYLTSAQASLVDSAGEELPHEAVHLHHAVWLNPTRRDLTCDAYDGGLPNYERFFASGKERTPLQLPEGYGYYWSNAAPQPHTESAPWWGLVVMLDGGHGNLDTFVELDVGFVPEAEAADMTAIRPVWLDVRNCSSHPVYDVAEGSGEGRIHRESWTHQLALGGRFVFLGGHLHDGGLALELANATTGEELFTSEAVYDKPEEPWFLTGMTTMSDPAGPVVAAGEELRLTAVYDSSQDWDNVMGIMLGALVPSQAAPPSASERAPSAAPADDGASTGADDPASAPAENRGEEPYRPGYRRSGGVGTLPVTT